MNPGTVREKPVLLSAELWLQHLGESTLQAALDFIWNADAEQDDLPLAVHMNTTICPANMRQVLGGSGARL